MIAPIANAHGVPADDTTRPASSKILRSALNTVTDVISTLQAHIHRFSVSHRGAYSVDQVQAFDTYQRQTPIWRVIWICTALPLSPLIAAIALECVPLQDPSLGWKANHGMYIRNFIMCIITGTGICIQTKQLMPILSMSYKTILFISCVPGVITNALLLLIAAVWVFPIPFAYVVAPIPNTTVLAVLFVLAIGRKQLKEKPSLVVELQKQSVIILVQVSLCIVYPIFNAIYLRLDPNAQTAFIFILPIIKFVMQNAIAWSTSHLMEYMPGVTLFSVEVFNALYMAKCMQNASSRVTYLVIMGADILKMAYSFYNLHGEANRMTELMQRCQLPPHASKSIIFTVLALCQQPAVLSSRGSEIKFRSELAHLWQSKSDVGALKQRSGSERSMVMEKRIMKAKPRKSPSMQSRMISPTKVIPLDNDLAITSASQNPVFSPRDSNNKSPQKPIRSVAVKAKKKSNALTPEEKREFVHDALKILFHCEYHLLVEYIEFMIPTIYSLYMAALFHLPTAAYYPETKNMTSTQLANLLSNVSTYACLELFSFLLLHFALKWKFGFSPAYLVAFVIENRFTELQARLIVWFPYVLGLTIEHLGRFSH